MLKTEKFTDVCMTGGMQKSCNTTGLLHNPSLPKNAQLRDWSWRHGGKSSLKTLRQKYGFLRLKPFIAVIRELVS